ncbi:putative secretion system X: hypothetical protein / Predicted secretion system X transmembrane protein 1 [Collimonas arenae]|uniref:Uncharacterized protein n=1 Tax=Collimonas arenae TaxID=279058 RepID=A0A0A1FEY0_9BURK|nr:hypothetical protein [Collimonas arenae]AIY41397.1 putative secretion system X: hypothetical protein / Predicted secretion system X transmembrane protein 1 [Collimonas arenae]
MALRRQKRSTLFIVIGARCVEAGVHAGGQWRKGSLQQVPLDLTQGVNAPIAALAQMELALTRWQETQTGEAGLQLADVRVLVADIWLSAASLPWSDMFKRANTTAAFARGQLEAAGFELSAADTVKLDDAPYGAPRLTLAYPTLLLAALSSLTTTLRTELSSLLPFSVAAWEIAPRLQRGKADALVVLDSGWLLTVLGADRITEINARPQVDGQTDLGGLREHIERLRLRDPHFSQVARVAVLDFLSPDAIMAASDRYRVALPPQASAVQVSSGLHLAMLARGCRLAIDAASARNAMTLKQGAIAGIAILLCGAMAFQTWKMHDRVRQLQYQLETVQAGRKPPPAVVNWSRDEISRVQAVNLAVRELNLPISTLLRALQPPVDILVGVLNVEVMGSSPASADGGSGVKIMAEAHSGDDMARYVAFVTERRPFTGAYLARHEIVETSPERPYRFTVEALWTE